MVLMLQSRGRIKMASKKRVFVAGHRGMVGAAIVRNLEKRDDVELILRDRNSLDLTNQHAVKEFMEDSRPDEVYLAAAKVGGIHANNVYPAEFIYQNLIIECNIIHSAHLANVKNLLFLGSSCIYPKFAEQPMRESALLTGVLEATNEPYAIAKIAGIKLCESYNRQYGRDYRAVMPTNLYGPNDNFHPDNSHVIPALLRRFHEAKLRGDAEVVAWGSGTPKREFLYVDDMASACVHVMELDKGLYDANTTPMLSHINVGTGEDCTIRELVETIAEVVGYSGAVLFDASKPDGTPRKLLSVDRLASLGWRYSTDLKTGLKMTYQWFLENQENFRS
jgi:GDP-L-fucose synthase